MDAFDVVSCLSSDYSPLTNEIRSCAKAFILEDGFLPKDINDDLITKFLMGITLSYEYQFDDSEICSDSGIVGGRACIINDFKVKVLDDIRKWANLLNALAELYESNHSK